MAKQSEIIKVLILAGCLAAICIVPTSIVNNARDWSLTGITFFIIIGFILFPKFSGPIALLGLFLSTITGWLPITKAFTGYSDKTLWLVTGAFALGSSVVHSGFGIRIANFSLKHLGRSTLGLGYAHALSELLLAPVVLSNTARGGGILAPINASLLTSLKNKGTTDSKLNAYLSLVGSHTNLITSAMFLSGSAINPVFLSFAKSVYGIDISWGQWALLCLLPALILLILAPFLILLVVKPAAIPTNILDKFRQEAIDSESHLSRHEYIIAITLGLLIVALSMQVLIPQLSIDAGITIWLAVLFIILLGADSWNRLTSDSDIWNTMLWLGAMFTLANGIEKSPLEPIWSGVIKWLGVTGSISILVAIAIFYFYSMYAFSLMTVHIIALASSALILCQAAGVPVLLAVGVLGPFSSLCACLTHYSTGQVIIYFGQSQMTTVEWWKAGLLLSVIYITVWLIIGFIWWKILGVW
jgi:divalent anion:Na+ symporter, DASS family